MKREEVCYAIRGKKFGSKELKVVKKCSVKYFDRGRTFISKKVCEALDWRQPNGWLKDRACRDVLIKLDELGIITLPKPKIKKSLKKTKILVKDVVLGSRISEMPAIIKFEFAKGNKEEELWNALVNRFHYLGHTVIVGRCIKYLVYGDDKLIGAIAFSSPANRLGVRDELLEQYFGFNKQDIKTFVINNTRFLILPNVSIKNLASIILSKATQQIVKDWHLYYSIQPSIVETFVQISKFQGTCYKASNWKCIGQTRGFSKKGNDYIENKEPKKIFLYGLNKISRKQLRNIA